MIKNYFLPLAKEIEEIVLFQAFQYNWRSRFPENQKTREIVAG